MQIEKLELTNYRNHKDLTLDFAPQTTLIVGPNGAGKTNVLEAIYLLATTKPYRTQYDRDVITYKKNYTLVEGIVRPDGHKDKLELTIAKTDTGTNTSTKKVKINGAAKALRAFATTFSAVMFSPEDIDIIIDSPTRRRKYLDFIGIQTDRKYKLDLSKYIKAVRQRNKLLEQINEFNTGLDQIEYWNEQILETGTYIQQKREEMIKFLESAATNYLKDLDLNLKISLHYKENKINKQRLEEYIQKEIAAKSTLVGPHRDNFEILIDGRNIAYFGSRGQQRTTLLALKLAEIDYFLEETQKRPLLLLDDIFSELDEAHKRAVFDVIDKQQTIITSTETLEGLNGYKKIKL